MDLCCEMDFYANTLEHLLAEAERVDLLIRAEVARGRRLNAADEPFQGLYISEQELDRLLARPVGVPAWAEENANRSRQDLARDLERIEHQIAESVSRSLERNVPLRLPRLAQLCGLDRFDLDSLLICLLPELDLRYERIYGYLHDDVTKKKPSIDLILNLLTPSLEARLTAQSRFSQDSALFRYHLLHRIQEPSQPNPVASSHFLGLESRVVSYLLGSDECDSRLSPYIQTMTSEVGLDGLLLADAVKAKLRMFLENHPGDGTSVLYLNGPYGAGKRSIAAALCREQELRLIVVDVDRLLAAGDDFFQLALGLAQREALLQGAALFFSNFDTLLDDAKKGPLTHFVRGLQSSRGLVFLGGEPVWEGNETSQKLRWLRMEVSRPSFPERLQLWSRALANNGAVSDPAEIESVATKFRFTPGQIRDAVLTATNMARWREPNAAAISSQDLYQACHLHSNRKLASLARKITPRHRWEDLVLPVDRLRQLREVCNYVKHRERVYGDWGFNRKLSYGKGLSVLFAGPSGTGKTMAAEIIAAELSLDLYKIDLSNVVSKYIGETEKNLSRIFAEAETSNAILFFDEADALFGKRSEVKDAHDRYANIEIGYLLTRMEEYEGVVILATNFRKNMDDAFVRRLHFTVEFPFPGEEDRHRIWEGIWPEETPLGPDVDLEFLAKHSEITGGNIRNIALAAAFLAADDGQYVGMDHLMRATEREYQKMGKIMIEGKFERRLAEANGR